MELQFHETPVWWRLGKLHGSAVLRLGRSCIVEQIEFMESYSKLKEEMDSSMEMYRQSKGEERVPRGMKEDFPKADAEWRDRMTDMLQPSEIFSLRTQPNTNVRNAVSFIINYRSWWIPVVSLSLFLNIRAGTGVVCLKQQHFVLIKWNMVRNALAARYSAVWRD